jgi:hypothetical protein
MRAFHTRRALTCRCPDHAALTVELNDEHYTIEIAPRIAHRLLDVVASVPTPVWGATS